MSLLAGGAANADYSSENNDFYDDYERICENPSLRQVEDICDDILTVRNSEAAAAVSYRVLSTHVTLSHLRSKESTGIHKPCIPILLHI